MAIHYYTMATQKGNVSAYYNIANVYKAKDDPVNEIKYLSIAATKGHIYSIDIIEKMLSKLEFFNIIKNLKDVEVAEKLLKLRNDPDVCAYISRIKLSEQYEIIEQCVICIDIKNVLPLSCGHKVCSTCYAKIDKCPLRCIRPSL